MLLTWNAGPRPGQFGGGGTDRDPTRYPGSMGTSCRIDDVELPRVRHHARSTIPATRATTPAMPVPDLEVARGRLSEVFNMGCLGPPQDCCPGEAATSPGAALRSVGWGFSGSIGIATGSRVACYARLARPVAPRRRCRFQGSDQ